MAEQLLKDPTFDPTEDILSAALGDIYPVYQAFCGVLAAAQVSMEWRYYNDGKAWLCKCQHKKKTVFWLSIWEGYFQTGFFFTEATYEGVRDLPFDEQPIRERNVGKFIPMVMKVSAESQLGDLAQLIDYKKSLK